LLLFTLAVRSNGVQAVISAKNMKLNVTIYRADHLVIEREELLNGSSTLLNREVLSM